MDVVKQIRGFALLSQERRREVASLGGKSSQALGVGHRWDKESATAAGRIGGKFRPTLRKGANTCSGQAEK